MFYHSYFCDYVASRKLPIYVNFIPRGTHPERLFHDHDYVEITLVSAGKALHLVEGAAVALEAGDVLAIPPGIVHAYDRVEDFEITNLAYKSRELPVPLLDASDLPLFSRFFPRQKDIAFQEAAKPIIRLSEEERKLLRADFSELSGELLGLRRGTSFHCMVIFMQILSRLARYTENSLPKEEPNYLLRPVLQYLNAHFCENITVEALVKKSNMSPRSFFRHFKEAVGYTPYEYITKLRIQHASAMLLGTEKKLCEIALECGFCDGNHLSKVFTAVRGMPPARFRRREKVCRKD